jgi:bromodomain-containing factor 1
VDLCCVTSPFPNESQGTEDEDMELDIDELSQQTLWKLLTYVRKHAPSEDPTPSFAPSSKAHHTHKDNAHVPRPKKKNKPMSKTEQEARIREMKSKLAKFESGSMSPAGRYHRGWLLSFSDIATEDDDDDSSGDDDDASGSESEEE